MSTVDERIVERFQLKAFVEACLVLEEGVAGVRDIDMGLMMGTGMIPGPFVRADLRGLDEVLAALERAEDEWGEHFEPPVILRRLVAQGRLGAKSGQGFYPYPQVESGLRDGAGRSSTCAARSRWCGSTTRPRTRSAPAVDRGARAGVAGAPGARRAGDGAGVAEPDAVLRRRRHQGVHAVGRRLRARAPAAIHALGPRVGALADRHRSPPSTAWRWAAAARSRWPATSGSPAARRPSASRRSTSGSSRASAARSGCRGSSGRRRRSR